jgi:uncharacterized protein
VGNLASVVLLFLPFILLTWLANLADARRTSAEATSGLATSTYVLVAIWYGLLLFAGLAMAVSGAFLPQVDLQSFLAARYEESGIDPLLAGRIVASLPVIGAGIAAASFVGLLVLLRPVRSAIAQVIPIDPDRAVHTVALALTMMVVINMVITLGIGLGALVELMMDGEPNGVATAVPEDLALPLTVLWIQQILMALWALIGVGWLSRRTLGAALRRLAIVVPSGSEVLVGVAVGLGTVFVSSLLAAIASAFGVGVDPDVEALNEVLLGPLFTSVYGVVTVGLAAALGEEAIFRGALQPRFGLILTTLLFAIVHSNYGLTISTLVVFVAGLIFGLLRQRYNTTTAMIAHASYNSTLALLAMLALRLMEDGQI